MDASAWLRTLGAQTPLRYGAMTAKLTKRGDHMVVKGWGSGTDSEDETDGAEHLEQMETYHKLRETAMLRRVLEAAEVDIDTTELTMKLEQAAGQKEASDGEASRTMRKTLVAAEMMTLKMATHRTRAEHIRHWKMNMAVARNNEKARQRASRALKVSLRAARRTVKDDKAVIAWQGRRHKNLAATKVPYHPSIEGVYMAAVKRASETRAE